MNSPLKIAVTGASGRMGQMLIKTIATGENMVLSGALEHAGQNWLGQDIGLVSGGQEAGVIVSDQIRDVFERVDAVIDFTIPAATVEFAKAAAETGTLHIIGTTGFTPEDIQEIEASAQKTAIVRAGNMSLGVNLLVKLTRQVAAALDVDFDIEVIEAHHNQKIDAPSGTALMLGEAAAEGRGVVLQDVRDTNRDGIVGARKKGDIGFVAIRGGDIVGEHDVLFASPSERITLRHVAQNRDVFARGALKAALWAQGKPAGAYDMFDVLGLT